MKGSSLKWLVLALVFTASAINYADRQIIALLKAISVEGGFKITNLMGLHSRNVPVRVIDARSASES